MGVGDAPRPEEKTVIPRRPWVCPRCDLKFEIPADAPAPEICIHCQRATHPAPPPIPVVIPELHEIAIEQAREEIEQAERIERRRADRSAVKRVSLIGALLAGMVADLMIGYRWGLQTERQRANAEIHQANSALEDASGRLEHAVAELRDANAEIEKANAVNQELREKLKAARLKPKPPDR